jgi:hypothetical protein
LWLNISNEYLPWYCPNPLGPTPPKGTLSRPYCKENHQRTWVYIFAGEKIRPTILMGMAWDYW